MSPLAETQGALREAIIDRRPEAILSALVGGTDPTYRLSIHQRHYEASLVKAITGRFPALEWLVGSEFLNRAASEFVRAHPPVKPCIAEYGEGFPRFLAGCKGAERMPWVTDVGAIEWHLGAVAVAVDRPAIGLESFTGFEEVPPEAISLTLQPGVRYVAAAWPVDELVKLYLSDSAPESFSLEPLDVHLEIRGARGAFSMNRLAPGKYRLRQALAAGVPLGPALAEAANDTTFDPGSALAAMFAEGLVTAIHNLAEGDA